MMSQKAHTKCKRVVFCLLPLYDKPQNNNVEVAGFNLIPKQKKGAGNGRFILLVHGVSVVDVPAWGSDMGWPGLERA